MKVVMWRGAFYPGKKWGGGQLPPSLTSLEKTQKDIEKTSTLDVFSESFGSNFGDECGRTQLCDKTLKKQIFISSQIE